jgi:hypothetical protein
MKPPGRVYVKLAACALTIAASAIAGSAVASSASAASGTALAACAFGTDVPGLTGFYPNAVEQAGVGYASHLAGADPATRGKAAQAFEAAAAAYVYGFPQVVERETVKHFVRNEIISVAAVTNPQVQTVVAPNVDTAYTVSWLDLTTGPMVINVPDTAGRFYTFQFLDAFTNAFAYVGTGSTGTHAGAYALIPPGYQGSLPAGVTPIQAPSNTVWLLGRTLVKDAADMPAVKSVQEKYTATPLTAWESGIREPPAVVDQYPPTIPKSIPTGTAFIAELNKVMNVDPPPAADDCALAAMAPAGVEIPHPTPAETLLDDLSDEAPTLPPVASDGVLNAAISAGTATGAQLVAAGDAKLNADSRGHNNGWEILGNWVGSYGTRYLGRAIVATDLLAANTPGQTIYPIADTDVTGRPLTGADRYTIRFPKGELPPVNAFWSLTMYNASYFLNPNQIDRYAIGDRTSGLQLGRDGSLTIYIQNAAPASAAQRANWLPAPAGTFHLILRLYQPKAAAIDERWKPAPVIRAGESLVPVLSALRVSPARFHPSARGGPDPAGGPARVSYHDSEATITHFVILVLGRRARCVPGHSRSCTTERIVARFSHADQLGANHLFLSGRARGVRLRPGRYVLKAVAGGTEWIPRGAADTASFRIV